MNVGRFEEVRGVEAESPPDIRQTPRSTERHGTVTCGEDGIRTIHEWVMSPAIPIFSIY